MVNVAVADAGDTPTPTVAIDYVLVLHFATTASGGTNFYNADGQGLTYVQEAGTSVVTNSSATTFTAVTDQQNNHVTIATGVTAIGNSSIVNNYGQNNYADGTIYGPASEADLTSTTKSYLYNTGNRRTVTVLNDGNTTLTDVTVAVSFPEGTVFYGNRIYLDAQHGETVTNVTLTYTDGTSGTGEIQEDSAGHPYVTFESGKSLASVAVVIDKLLAGSAFMLGLMNNDVIGAQTGDVEEFNYAVTSTETADSPTTLTQKLTVVDAPTATFSEYMSVSIFSSETYGKDFTVSNISNATGLLQYIDNGVTNASGHRQYVLLLPKFANYTDSPTLTNGQLKMDYESSSGNGTATLSSITDLGFVGPNGEEAVLVDVDFGDSFNGNLTFYANDIVITQASDPYNYTQLADGNGGALFYDVSDVKNTNGWGDQSDPVKRLAPVMTTARSTSRTRPIRKASPSPTSIPKRGGPLSPSP